MKFFLSSYRLGPEPELFYQLFGKNKKVAVIASANDYNSDEEIHEKEQREIEDLVNIGLEPDVLTLRDYFERKNELKEKLGEYGGVWVLGGNTFLLVEALRRSGAEEFLKENGSSNFVFGGYSAAAVALAPTLDGVDLVDPKNMQVRNYNAKSETIGLNLFSYYFLPHFGDYPDEHPISQIYNYFKSKNYQVVTIEENDFIIFDKK